MHATRSPGKAQPRIIRDKEFGKRLSTACDNNPQVPGYHYGRTTWLVKQFKDRFRRSISPETARKWFAGESVPRRDKMRLIAQLLEVDEGWLAFGITPDLQPREKRVRSIAVGGAVNLVTGVVQIDGGIAAFPGEQDSRNGYVHLYAIIKGAQYAIHAALAQEASKDVYRFTVPVEFNDCLVVGVVPRANLRFDFLELTTDMIDAHKSRKGGAFEIEVQRKGEDYATGKARWPRITSFQNRI